MICVTHELSCDGCKEFFGSDESERHLEKLAKQEGWFVGGGNHFCKDCKTCKCEICHHE